jgi:hypothetical protein
MRIDLIGQYAFDDGQNIFCQRGATGHPLEVGTLVVVVGPIQAGTREKPLQPTEDRLMPDVHLEGDLRLLAVSTEVPLADEQTRYEPPLDIRDLMLQGYIHTDIVSRGRKT